MQIEKGIPLARQLPRSEGARLVSGMEPGDSMLTDSESTARNMTTMGRKRGWKMAQRKVEGGWRVWRL